MELSQWTFGRLLVVPDQIIEVFPFLVTVMVKTQLAAVCHTATCSLLPTHHREEKKVKVKLHGFHKERENNSNSNNTNKLTYKASK